MIDQLDITTSLLVALLVAKETNCDVRALCLSRGCIYAKCPGCCRSDCRQGELLVDAMFVDMTAIFVL